MSRPSPGPAADSAGRSWSGRDLPPTPYADDDGRADDAVSVALDRLGSGPDAESELVRALGPARVFVGVAAVPGEGTDMGLVVLDRPDGRRSLPVFTTVGALLAWREDARPVPAQGRRVALSAVADGCDLLHLDPAGPVEYLVRRPAVWALAQASEWRPSHANPIVAQEISRIGAELSLALRCEPGASAELRLLVSLPPGLDAPGLDQVTAALSGRLAQSVVVADLVDSLEVTVRSA